MACNAPAPRPLLIPYSYSWSWPFASPEFILGAQCCTHICRGRRTVNPLPDFVGVVVSPRIGKMCVRVSGIVCFSYCSRAEFRGTIIPTRRLWYTLGSTSWQQWSCLLFFPDPIRVSLFASSVRFISPLILYGLSWCQASSAIN